MVRQINPSLNSGKAITRGAFPKVARSLYVKLPFSLDTVIQAQLPMQTGNLNVSGIDMVQSIFIDNSDNGELVTFDFSNGFSVACPPYAQAILPVLASGDTGVDFKATSIGGVDVDCWFTNTREQPAVWVAGYPISGVINISGSVIYSTVTKGTLADFSKALTAGGVSETLIAADGNRIALLIKNPATPAGQGIAAPEPAYINFGAAAVIGGVSSVELLPGETLTAANIGLSPTQAVSWNATTIGHQIYCKAA